METAPFEDVFPIRWEFSIAMLVYQRVTLSTWTCLCLRPRCKGPKNTSTFWRDSSGPKVVHKNHWQCIFVEHIISSNFAWFPIFSIFFWRVSMYFWLGEMPKMWILDDSTQDLWGFSCRHHLENHGKKTNSFRLISCLLSSSKNIKDQNVNFGIWMFPKIVLPPNHPF